MMVKEMKLICKDLSIFNVILIATLSILYIPFTQGDGRHSSTFISHLIPEKPASQLQVKPLTLS